MNRVPLPVSGSAPHAPSSARRLSTALAALRRLAGGRVDAVPNEVRSNDSRRFPAIARAMTAGELRLVYQPKLNLRSRRIVGLEALLRWRHPDQGEILPGAFIPAAEQSTEIQALSLWVIARAIDDRRLFAARGHDLTVFVNVAAILLADDEFVGRACAMIEAAGHGIGLEITETSVIRDPDAAIANLNRLSALGIPIAIDDYGAGLSSLAYLKQLPACELKIDKLFITQLTSSPRDPLIVRSTIDLAHAMEMEVVAEGVESATALALLSVMGCDMAQGFYISRPMEIGAVVAFLDEHRERWNEATEANSLSQLATALKRA